MSRERRSMDATFPAERLREMLRYDPDTGIFTHRMNRVGGVRAGQRADSHHGGRSTRKPYRYISVDCCGAMAHRAAWLYVYGEWPSRQIDHINGDYSDNRIANLRLATRSQNKANTARYSNNSTGFKGVTRSRHGTFVASIRKDRKPYYLGTFGDPREAHAAYDRAAREMFGEFANAGTLTFQSSMPRGGPWMSL